MRSGVQEQPGQHVETISTKNIKISWAWWNEPVIPATWEAEAGGAWTQEVEVAVSRDRDIALQPGQQERNNVSKIIIINKNKIK